MNTLYFNQENNSAELDSDNIFYSLPFGINSEVTSKHYTRFIKACERVIRSNKDYSLYLESLREVDILSKDAFLKNLTSNVVEIQLHHYPITLFNICHYVTNQLFTQYEYVTTFMVADEVINLHFQNKVGLVGLSTTMHEIEHITGLPIIERQIYGDWKYFLDFELTESDKLKVEALLARNNQLTASSFDRLKVIPASNLLEIKEQLNDLDQ